MTTCTSGEAYEPSHDEIRLRRLHIAIEKLHRLPAGQTRDSLILDMESLIGNILNAGSADGLQGGRRHG